MNDNKFLFEIMRDRFKAPWWDKEKTIRDNILNIIVNIVGFLIMLEVYLFFLLVPILLISIITQTNIEPRGWLMIIIIAIIIFGRFCGIGG